MSKLTNLSTFDLAFNLAMGGYSEKEKMEALSIIKDREGKLNSPAGNLSSNNTKPKKPFKQPVKGSKAEKILLMLQAGKTPKEVFENLNKRKDTVVYYPEIYRIVNGLKDSV